MSINYREICLDVVGIARSTGIYIREARENEMPSSESKGKNDFVTKFDKEAEARIVAQLIKILPDAGYITEEDTIDKKGEVYNWIIDPIDGTTNFIHGLFPYSVSIALIENNEVVVGVIYEPGLDECFYAWKDGVAMLNGKEIKVSSAKHVADSLIATGFPYTNFKLLDKFIESLHYFMFNSHGMRRMGSAAVDLAYVACGRFDAFYEYDLKPWDVAAGVLIVECAGGRISDFSGGRNFLFGREIIASNTNVFDEFYTQVARFLVK